VGILDQHVCVPCCSSGLDAAAYRSQLLLPQTARPVVAELPAHPAHRAAT
jgi:hypothetical protein